MLVEGFFQNRMRAKADVSTASDGSIENSGADQIDKSHSTAKVNSRGNDVKGRSG